MTAVHISDFLTTGNQVYISEVYERFLDDPGSVDPRWQTFFSGLCTDLRGLLRLEKVPHSSALCYVEKRLLKKGLSTRCWRPFLSGPRYSA